MTYQRVSLELSGAWVLSHRDVDQLPIQLFIDFCKQTYNDKIQVENVSFTSCILVIQQESLESNDIKDAVTSFLKDTLLITEDADSNLTVEPCEMAAELPKEPDVAQTTESSAEEKSETQGDKPEKLAQYQPKDKDTAGQVSFEKRVSALIGAESFQSLLREIQTIAPGIVSHKTFEAFVFQSYLFSINDGCGLTTALELLAESLEQNKLFHFGSKKRVIEEKLLPPGSEKDPFASVLLHFQGYGKSEGPLISIDISEWMTKLTEKSFRDFLMTLENHSANHIFVFRIPFVEAEVLDGIQAALQDVLFIRTVPFPPMDMEDLTACAKRYLEKLGFTAEQETWSVFLSRMMEEKSDGRFYGINTVNKVIREMVYRKQLSDAIETRDDTIIKANEILSLSKTYHCRATDAMYALEQMIGMQSVKESVKEIVAQILLSRSNPKIGSPCIHMRFVGSPGTGKTTVARLLGRILKENGVLRNGNFFEYTGRDFCGRYVGETAPKTAAMCRDAYGSVLFIDEAYSLYRGDDMGRDFGREALDTLIAEMENHRSDLVVIMAGYTDEMELLMKGNTGLESRMPYCLSFPNYTREELCAIFFQMLGDVFTFDEAFRETVNEYFDSIQDEALFAKDFSNARFVRNLFERTCAKASLRKQFDVNDPITLTKEDFTLASAENSFRALVSKKGHSKIGF